MNGGGKQSPPQMCDHLPTFLQIIIIITVPIINILGKYWIGLDFVYQKGLFGTTNNS